VWDVQYIVFVSLTCLPVCFAIQLEDVCLCPHVTLPLPSAFTRCSRASCIQPYAHCEPLVFVAKSAVHGYGVFARRDIEPGELVCMYSGMCVDYVSVTDRSDYILEILWLNVMTGEQETWYLDASNKDNAAGRWVNDARNTQYSNNVHYTNYPLKRHPLNPRIYYVWMKALCKIAQGDEFFVSYSEDKYWNCS